MYNFEGGQCTFYLIAFCMVMGVQVQTKSMCFFLADQFLFSSKNLFFHFQPKSTKKTGFLRLFHRFACNRSSSGLSFFSLFLFKQNSDPIKFTAFIWLSIHRRDQCIQNVPNKLSMNCISCLRFMQSLNQRNIYTVHQSHNRYSSAYIFHGLLINLISNSRLATMFQLMFRRWATMNHTTSNFQVQWKFCKTNAFNW